MIKWLKTLVSRATPENPRFSLNDPAAWDMFTGGQQSSAGINVNYESALTYSPWWRGVNLISRDVAKLPMAIYRRNGEGKERDTQHPAYRLLRYKPNREMTAFVFRQTLQAHALNDGNGYAFIFRAGDGTPLELVPLLPEKVTPVRENGSLQYVLSVGSEMRRIDPSNILHIKGLSFDGLVGYSLWQKAKQSIGLGMASEQFGSRYFSNGAEPRAVIEHPAKLSEKAAANLRNSWNSMHQGIENSHKIAILEEGMKINAFSNNARDAQLLETRQFQIRDIANWLGVPPHKLGDTTRTAFASLEQENQSYLDDAVDPWLVNWEEECREKLLTEEEKVSDSHVIEFIRNALVRADLTARANYYRTALGGRPWMTQNEVRGRENMNPMEGGDTILEPLNMGDNGGADNQPDPIASEAARQSLIDTVRRMVRRLTTAIQRATDKPEWIEKHMRADHAETIRQAIQSPASALAAIHSREANVPKLVEQLFKEFESAFTTREPIDSVEIRIAESIALKAMTARDEPVIAPPPAEIKVEPHFTVVMPKRGKVTRTPKRDKNGVITSIVETEEE